MKRLAIGGIGLWAVLAIGVATASAAPDTVESWGGAGAPPPAPLGSFSGVTAISAGGTASAALLSDGTAMIWGSDEYGQHGDGTLTLGPGPPQPVRATQQGITAISVGTYHVLALLGNGHVAAWGRNDSGHLGVPSSGPEFCNQLPCSTTPREIPNLHDVVAISADSSPENQGSDLALLSDGHVMAWGGGVGYEPVVVKGLKEVASISSGNNHDLALLDDGTVEAWGANGSGQLGDGSTIDSASPVPVSGLSGVTEVSAGNRYSLALLGDGSVKAWGENAAGQLGDGSTTNRDLAVTVTGTSNAAGVSAGTDHSLALLADGTVMAWGENGQGQLGDGSTANSDVPVAVDGLGEVAGVSAGDESLSFGAPPPVIAGLSAGSGTQAGGTAVTITGEHFSEATAVRFGSTPAAVFTVNSDTSITATSPPGRGTVAIFVTTPAETSNGATFAYIPDPPEFGRCLKLGEGTGKYSNPGCTNGGLHGLYEWDQAIPHPGFTLAGASATLETRAKVKVACAAVTGTGEYIEANDEIKTVGHVVLEFTGCESQGHSCTTEGSKAGEITTHQLTGEPGWTNKAKHKVALELGPTSGAFLSFECSPSESAVVNGSVLVPLQVAKMQPAALLKYSGKHGKQKPEELEGAEKAVLQLTLQGGAPEEVGLTVRLTQQNEEPIEVSWLD